MPKIIYVIINVDSESSNEQESAGQRKGRKEDTLEICGEDNGLETRGGDAKKK